MSSEIDLKALLDSQKSAHAELVKTLNAHSAEIQKHGQAHADTVAKLEKLAEVVADLETKMQRPAPVKPREKRDGEIEQTAEVKAFEKFVRYGLKGNAAIERMTDEERAAFKSIQQKALSESDDTRGGFAVPEDVRTEVIRRIPYFSGVGQLVNRSSTSRDIARWPRLTGGDDIKTSGAAVTYEDETDSLTETDFAMGSAAIPIRKARTLVKISNDLLEDQAVDILGLMADLAAEAFGQDEEKQITIGAGSKTPVGFMTDTDIGQVAGGHASNVIYDGFVDLMTNLAEQYTANARFMFKRLTLGAIMKIKIPAFSGDTAGIPLWQPAIAAGQPGTILGHPYSINEYLPTIAANAFPVVFGDFKRLYLALDRAGMSTKRLDEKYADTDEVGFIFRRRWGGRVLAPWAAKKMKIATSV